MRISHVFEIFPPKKKINHKYNLRITEVQQNIRITQDSENTYFHCGYEEKLLLGEPNKNFKWLNCED